MENNSEHVLYDILVPFLAVYHLQLLPQLLILFEERLFLLLFVGYNLLVVLQYLSHPAQQFFLLPNDILLLPLLG